MYGVVQHTVMLLLSCKTAIKIVVLVKKKGFFVLTLLLELCRNRFFLK